VFTPTVLGSKEAEMRIIGCDLHARQQTLAMLPSASRATLESVQSTSTLSMDQRILWTSYPSSRTSVQFRATFGMEMDLRMTYFAKGN